MNTDEAPATANGDVGLTVGQVAAACGLSVRTLHHWDAIGLAEPSDRSWAGYRLYSAADLARLHRVLIYRDLGFGLGEIQSLLDDPEVDVGTHLRRQRELLRERISHLQQTVCAVEKMMENHMTDEQLSAAEQAAILGDSYNPRWQAEAEEKWGETPEWAAAEEVKAGMNRADWQRVKDETEALEADLAAAFQAGTEPGSEAANALAERHRASISQWFAADHAKHVCIARGYTEDDRFRDHYDRRAPGLAGWLRQVVEANAQAAGVDPETATWE